MNLKLITDWSKLRYIMFIVYTISALLASTVASELITSGKHKRELFREHLLPQQGGKIPETAFKPDRLSLNRFNQNGLYSPDGIYLHQRHPNDNYLRKQYLHNTLKININPYKDNKDVIEQPERYYLPQILDTNYLVRKPVNQIIYPKNLKYKYLPNLPEHSLKLVRQYKYNNNNKFNKYWPNWIESSNGFHEQVLDKCWSS